MSTLNINFGDELTIIFLWIGIWGVTDELIYSTVLYEYKKYIYILLILSAIYLKI